MLRLHFGCGVLALNRNLSVVIQIVPHTAYQTIQ